jgi:hypothetical protein
MCHWPTSARYPQPALRYAAPSKLVVMVDKRKVMRIRAAGPAITSSEIRPYA